MTTDYFNAMESEMRVWFAPIAALELSKWTTPAESAEAPQVGETYAGTLGFCPRSIRMSGKIWLPADQQALEPFEFDENGKVTVTGPEDAVYTGDNGQKVRLAPVHPIDDDPDPGC